MNFEKLKIKKAHHKSNKRINAEVKGWYNDLEVKRKLTKAQKKEILDFYYSLTGKKISLVTHEYFYSRTGIYSKEYVPKDLYINDIQPKANDLTQSHIYGNKNLSDVFLPKDIQPRAILKNINGLFYYDGEPVSLSEAIEKCKNIGDVVIKPSNLSQGRGVQRVIVSNGLINNSQQTIEDLIKSYKNDFIIQEALTQHEAMSALNPTSVNTIRIVTYRADNNEVLHIYSVARIGRKGCFIDNQCAGGISTIVSEDGKLGKYAFGGYAEGNITQTDTGVVLDGYQLPSYDKALNLVNKLHLYLPYFRLIGWDVAIDKDGTPKIIEYNTKPQLSQSAFGPGFGKYTERIIREIWKNKNSKFAY